jgi:hypothetical protein
MGMLSKGLCQTQMNRTPESNMNLHPKGMSHAAEHAERMAFIGRRFKPANLLLRSFQLTGKFLLGKAGFFAQGGDLKGDIPRFSGFREPFRKIAVFQLFF